MSDVQSEISFGQIAASNSLNRSPLGVNKYLMEKNFMHYAWKLLFSTWSDLDREENL
jgi:hypothetical protein